MSLLEYIHKDAIVNKKAMNFRIIEKGFVNLTTLNVDKRVAALLSFGPEFQPRKKVNNIDIIENMAKLNKTITTDLGIQNPDTLFYEMYHTHGAILDNIIHPNNMELDEDELIFTTLNKAIKLAKDFFSIHKDVCIVQADKGKATALMYKEEYMTKMDEFIQTKIKNGTYTELEDKKKTYNIIKATYHGIRRNIIKIYMDADNTKKPFTNKLFCLLKQNTSTTAPYLTGTIKLHKIEKTMRPICSSHLWYTSAIQKIIKYVLEDTLKDKLCKQNIRNIDDFCTELKDINMVKNYSFVKMDINDMYGSTNREDLLELLYGIIENENFKEKCSIPVVWLKTMLRFSVVTANIVTFKEKTYIINNGLPQGACDSGLYATIYVDYILQSKEEELTKKHNITWWHKYMDDFIFYMKEENIEEFKDAFDTYTGYTTEWEKETKDEVGNYSLSFLDINIIRTDTDIKIRSYKKDMASARMIHNWSDTPKIYKDNTIVQMMKKILKRTDTEYLNEDIIQLKRKLLNNAYEVNYINKITNDTIIAECIRLFETNTTDLSKTKYRIFTLSKITGLKFNTIIKKAKYCHNISKKRRIKSHQNKNMAVYTYKGQDMQRFIKLAHKTLNLNMPIFKKEQNALYKITNISTPTTIQKTYNEKIYAYPPFKTSKVFCTECDAIFFISGRGDHHDILKRHINNQNSEIHKHIIRTGHKINKTDIIYTRNIKNVDYNLQTNIRTNTYKGKHNCLNKEPPNLLPGYLRSLIRKLEK